MAEPHRLPSVICFGRGYASRFAGWTLAGAGADVTLGHLPDEPASPADPLPGPVETIGPDALARRLAEVDICVTDSAERLQTLLGGSEPWPPALSRLTLVDIGWPAASADANSRIAELSGLGAVIGDADGPGRPPPGRMLEAVVGLQAATAALAGWLGARRDGLGEHVLVDPVSCVAGMSGVNAIQFLNYGLRWRRSGRSASGSGGPFPFRMFRCADGWVVVICRSLAEWQSFVAMLGDPPWSQTEEYRDPLVIAKHHAEAVAALVQEALAERTVADVVEDARRHRVPLTTLRTTAEALADPRLFAEADPARPVPAVTAVRTADVPLDWRRRPAPHRAGEPAGPLHGLRVLDLGWVWAAPIGAAWLADLGADVVKVESMDRLDLSRRRGLEFPAGLAEGRATLPGHERAWLYSAVNRNKRSTLLELKDPAHRERFLGYVAQADVLVESFSTGVLERLGVGPDVLFGANRNLVLVSMGGRTVDGEYLTRSYAPLLSALAGIERLVVDAAGDPLGLLNWGVADPNAGAWAAFAVVAALATNRGGSHLLVSQLRALVNTCLSAYRGLDPEPATLGDPAEATAGHLAGTAGDALGDVYRSVLVRSWSPDAGERVSFGSPWRFARMPVGVRVGAPLLGSTTAEDLATSWRVTAGRPDEV